MISETRSSRTLLIVDDQLANRQTLHDTFVEEGFDVLSCSTVGQAIELFAEHKIAVAILDLQIGDDYGIDLLEKLRKIQPAARIIIHTAFGTFDSARDALNLGAFAYLEKHSDIADLVGHVHRAFKEGLLDELGQSEQRYRDLLDDTAAIVWECDYPDWQVTFISRQVESILGHPVSHWIEDKEHWVNLIHPEDRQRVVKYCSDCTLIGDDYEFEFRAIAADGRVVWLHDVVHVVHDANGIPVQLRGVMLDISARMEAESKFRENEQRMGAVFNSTFQMIGRLSPEGILLEANQAALGFGGVNLEDVINKPFWETVWWSGNDMEIDRLRSAVQRAANGEFVRYNMEANAVGRIETIDFSIKPIFDDQKKVHMLIAEGRLITEQQAVVKALQESEEKFRSLVESAPVCIHELDHSGHLTSINAAGLQMLDIADEADVIGSHYMLLVADRDKTRIGKLLDQAGAGQSSRFEFTSTLGRSFDSCFVPMKTDDARVDRIMGITRDISEQVVAEQKIRESESRFRAIFEQVAVGVVHIDTPSGRILRANKRFCEIIDTPLDQPDGTTWIDLVHDGDVDTELDNVRRLRSGELEKYSSEQRLKRADNSLAWVNVTVSPMSHADDETKTHIVIVEDISDQKLVEDQLQLAQFSIENCATAIFWIRRDASFLFVNESGIQRFGYSKDEWSSMTVHDIDPMFPVEVWLSFWEEVAEKKTLAFETVMTHASGSGVPVKITTNLLQFRGEQFLFAFVTDISDRLKAEKKLKLSESLYRAMFEQAAVGVGQLDSRSGQFLEINQRYCDIAGYSREQMLQTDFVSITHPDDVQDDQDQMSRLRRGEIHEFTMEKRYIRDNGSTVWVNLTVSPMWKLGEEASTHIAIVEDITTRKLAELKLRESEVLFRELVETAPFGVQRNDTNGRIIFANAKLGLIYGCPEKELVGKFIWDFAISPKIRAEMQEFVADHTNNPVQYPAGFETRNRTLDGRIINVHVDWTYDRDDQGKILGFLVVVTDITARKRAERDLEFQADVLNRVSDAVMVTDQSGAVTYANEAAERLLHVRAEYPAPVELPRPGPAVESAQTCLLATGSWEGENQFQVDGQTRIFETKQNVFCPSGTDESLVLTVMHDISARKRADLEIRQHAQMLSHMTRLSTMGELVAGIAHEVKQPLYAVTNFATAAAVTLDIIESGETMEEQLLEALKECNEGVRDAAQRASDIISHSMAFAKKGERQREQVDINECVKDAIELIHFEARQNETMVKTELKDNLPFLFANRIQCEQVLVNLLNNALEDATRNDATRNNSPRQVIVRTTCVEGVIEVQVEDNGSGISDEDQGKLFDAFFTTKEDGMGVGLAISRTIIEDHEGRIWVTRNESGGSTFHFTLPLQSTSNLEQRVES